MPHVEEDRALEGDRWQLLPEQVLGLENRLTLGGPVLPGRKSSAQHWLAPRMEDSHLVRRAEESDAANVLANLNPLACVRPDSCTGRLQWPHLRREGALFGVTQETGHSILCENRRCDPSAGNGRGRTTGQCHAVKREPGSALLASVPKSRLAESLLAICVGHANLEPVSAEEEPGDFSRHFAEARALAIRRNTRGDFPSFELTWDVWKTLGLREVDRRSNDEHPYCVLSVRRRKGG